MKETITKDEIRKRLTNIARMLKKEYELESRKTVRAIYREVAALHNTITDLKFKGED